MSEKKIDIIIPSYRFDQNEAFLIVVADLPCPTGWNVQVIIIGDHPSAVVPSRMKEYIEKGKIKFIQNEINRGPNFCRNVGLDLSDGDWILYLDDDIVPDQNLLFSYKRAIDNNPDAAGFAGVVNFPPANSRFTEALVKGQYTFYFEWAKHKTRVPWAVAANVLLNRKKIGDMRFSNEFLRNENGEEVEFFVRYLQKYQDSLVTVSDAIVTHPWWFDGKANYNRTFSYNRGNYRLIKLHPALGYFRFCNTVDLLIILCIAAPFGIWWLGIAWWKWPLMAVFFLLIDLIAHLIPVIKKHRVLHPIVAFHIWFMTIAGYLSYATVCLRNFYFIGLFKKFDIMLRPNGNHFHTNTRLIIKALLLIAAAFFALYL
jgi:glycosyltransferase involved in cell wall biosynthesis